jgi:hypothetical protein
MAKAVAEPSAHRINLIPPNHATLLGLRGLLLHADYTRELADRRLASGLRLKDADRVVRDGIWNPDIYTKRVHKKVFDRWDLPQASFICIFYVLLLYCINFKSSSVMRLCNTGNEGKGTFLTLKQYFSKIFSVNSI